MSLRAWRAVLAALLSLALAASPPAEAAGPTGSASVRILDESVSEDLMILGLRLGDSTLSDALIVYQDPDDIDTLLLPLGDVARALEFAIEVDADSGTAEGWVLSESHVFKIDVKAGTLIVDGEPRDFSESGLQWHEGDIYVDSRLLEELLPARFELNYRNLTVQVTATEPLPVEIRLAKEERRAGLVRESFEETDLSGLILPETQLFAGPFIDNNVQFSYSKRENEDATYVGQYTSNFSALVNELDLAGSFFGSWRTDGEQDPPNLRVTVGRRSPERDLFPPLALSAYDFGDVASPLLPLVAENRVGRGASLSSFPLTERGRANRLTLRGELPAGWEVELYRNGELLDFQTGESAPNDGRYEFNGVRTLAGLNVFRLVFYGPQGQRREEVERFYNTGNLLPEDDTAFSLAVNQVDRDLIDFDTDDEDPSAGSWRGNLRVEHGLDERTTLTFGLAALTYETPESTAGSKRDDSDGYALGGLTFNWDRLTTRIDLATALDGGFAGEVNLRTTYEGLTLELEHDEFFDFESEEATVATFDKPLRRRTQASFSGPVTLGDLGTYPITLSGSRLESDNGEREYGLLGRISGTFLDFTYSVENQWRLRESRSSDGRIRNEPADGSATLRVGTLVGNANLRGEARYRISPDSELSNANATLDWRIDGSLGGRVGVRHSGGEQEVTTLLGGLTWDLGQFAFGLNGDIDTDREVNGVVSLRLSLGVDSERGRVKLSSQPMSGTGGLVARVFLDHDGDGRYDSDDEPLPDVELRGSGLSGGHRTESDGTVFITGLRTYRNLEVRLQEASLPDPFLTPPQSVFQVRTRPGGITSLDVPVVPTGDVDGQLWMTNGSDEEDRRPAGGIPVVLLSDGQVIASVKASFDGYFYLDRVPYGSYALTVDPAYLEKQGFSANSLPVTLNSEEPSVYDQELVIRRPARQARRPASAAPG